MPILSGSNKRKKIISVEDFTAFAKQAQPLTKQVCLHLMGEPLAHPQFQAIMQVCEDLNLKIFLTTNGTLLKRHSEALLKWKALEQINFSVHSYFANETVQSLESYLAPILEFSERACEQQKPFYINLRLWNLAKTNEQSDQNRRVFDILNPFFKVKLNETIDVKLNKSKKIKHKLYVHFDTEFIWPSPEQKIRSEAGSCYGLRKQLAIHANGDVVPCCLDKESVLKLGNMHTEGLGEILKSDRAKKIKKGFENNQLVEDLCRKCQYADRFRSPKENTENV
ncbi:MAG: radical SAM/SPASM domain-containing protein [Pseudobdellovibrio sp.]